MNLLVANVLMSLLVVVYRDLSCVIEIYREYLGFGGIGVAEALAEAGEAAGIDEAAGDCYCTRAIGADHLGEVFDVDSVAVGGKAEDGLFNVLVARLGLVGLGGLFPSVDADVAHSAWFGVFFAEVAQENGVATFGLGEGKLTDGFNSLFHQFAPVFVDRAGNVDVLG